MIYTAIFENAEGRYSYDIFDAPHGFSAAWPAIVEGGSVEGRCLVAVIPGNHQVGFYNDYVNGPAPFSQPRRLAAWSVR